MCVLSSFFFRQFRRRRICQYLNGAANFARHFFLFQSRSPHTVLCVRSSQCVCVLYTSQQYFVGYVRPARAMCDECFAVCMMDAS